MALGLLFSAAAKAFAPRIAREALESGVSTAVSGALSRRVSSYTAGQAGQRLVARASGQRFATKMASEPGQQISRYLVKKDTSNRLQSEGEHAVTPGPKVILNNSSTVPKTVSDPSQMNMVANPHDPVMAQYRENQRLARQQGGGRNRQSGSGPTGWMGTGKGWWEQNEQITQKGAFAGDVTQLGDFSVARGPTRWAHSLGKGLARGTVARGVGFVEGVRSVELPESGPNGRYGKKNPGGGTNVPGKAPTGGTAGTAGQTAPTVKFSTDPGEHAGDVQEHTLKNVRQTGRGGRADIPSSTGGSDSSTSGTYVGTGPHDRLSHFQTGSGELGTGPQALGPGAKPRRKAGMGQYGRDRFASMMKDVGY